MTSRARIAAAAAAIALAPAASLAVDGVILIDQNKALAGNVTPGDAPGYPVTIGASGSYRLSGNLTVPHGTNGIVVAVDGVTLDLNGYSISGAGPYGISDGQVERNRIRVRNGHVSGFSSSVRLLFSSHVVVEDMMLDPGSGGVAIAVGAFSRLHGNTVFGNGLIQATCPSIVTENVSDGFISVFVTDQAKQCIRYHNRALGYGNPISE